MILYDYILSPDCYKVRLLASLVGARLDLRAVDFHPGAEHRSAPFLRINPAGTIPVLQDGDLILTESAAILTYVAASHGPDWLGDDTPVMRGRVAQWLAFGHRLSASIGKARTHDMLQKPADIDACRADALGGTACRTAGGNLDLDRCAVAGTGAQGQRLLQPPLNGHVGDQHQQQRVDHQDFEETHRGLAGDREKAPGQGAAEGRP